MVPGTDAKTKAKIKAKANANVKAGKWLPEKKASNGR